MAEWTDEQLRAQGYELDSEHPANLNEPNKENRRINDNAAKREAGLPCSRSAGEPLEPSEQFTPKTEVERLFPDQARVRAVQEYRHAAGLPY